MQTVTPWAFARLKAASTGLSDGIAYAISTVVVYRLRDCRCRLCDPCEYNSKGWSVVTSVLDRNCTKCGKPAKYVASDDLGLQWFECGNHDPKDNVARVLRMSLTSIDDWFRECVLLPLQRKMPVMNKPLELENTERLLLAVALREYLGGLRHGMNTNDPRLVDHPTSKLIIERILERLDFSDESSTPKE